MNPLWTLLFVLSAPRGVLSQMQLRESGPSLVKPSQTLSLTCTVSGFSLSSYAVAWVRQAPGKALEWIGGIGSDGATRSNSALKSRLSITADNSKSQVSLRVHSVTPEDTATYYCAKCGYGYGGDCLFAYYSNLGEPVEAWGQGLLVTVSSESETSPSIFPLSLGNEDPAGQVVIGCLVQGFFPSAPLSVTWNQNGDSVTVRNFPAVLAGNLYTMSSQLTLPASLCPKDQSVTCQVQHLSKASETVAVPCKCKGPECPEECLPLNCKPSLSLQPPALEDLLLGSNASLTCTLSGLKSAEGASFTWNPTGGKTAIQGSPKRDSCGCYSVSSVLPGCADPWNSGQTFSCSATDPESRSSLTATIKKDLGNTFRPQVHLLPPPSEELALNELVTLTCLVRGFSPKEVLVRWLQGNQELPPEKYLTWGPLPEAGQSVATFAVTSVLRVDAEVWKQGDTFSCMVGHEALPLAFTQKTIDRLAEPQPWLVLDLMQSSPEEDSPEASLWPTTVTLLTLFLLSLFYSTALTVTSIRTTPDSREVPQY